jgi:peptidyl-prolyl cis-trans isomerase C
MLKTVTAAFLRWPIVVRIVAAACTPLVVVGLLLAVVPRFTQLPRGVAFQVYGQDVTVDQLQHRLTVLKALYGIAPPADPAAMDTFRRTSAEAVVVSMVIDRAAQEQHATVTDKDGREALGQLVGTFPDGINGFARMLGSVGATENDVVDELKRQQATHQLYEKITAEQGPAGQVSLPQAQAYYDQHQAQFVLPETRHLRNIVVATQSDANDVLQQSRAGTDFGVLAQQNSLDQSTAPKGGDLGSVTKDQLQPPFAAAAFGAANGAVFGPVQTPQGWDVGQVLGVQPPTQQPFQQIGTQLAAWLTSERAVAHWRAFLAGQLADADVRYADAYRPADPTGGLGAAPGAPEPGTPEAAGPTGQPAPAQPAPAQPAPAQPAPAQPAPAQPAPAQPAPAGAAGH